MSGRHRREDEDQSQAATQPASAHPPTVEPPHVDLAERLGTSRDSGGPTGRRRAPGPPDTGHVPVAPAEGVQDPVRMGRRRREFEDGHGAGVLGPHTGRTDTASAPPTRRDPTQARVPGLAPSATTPPPLAWSGPSRVTRPSGPPHQARTPAAPTPVAPTGVATRPPQLTTTPPQAVPDGADDVDTAEPSAAPATAVTPTIVSRVSRAGLRERERTRARRVRALIIGVVVLALIAGGAGVWRLTTAGAKKSTGAVATKQRTMLLQLAGPTKKAVASALVGVTDAKSDASVVLIPSRLVTDVAGAGSMPFGDVLSLPDVKQSGNALTDLIGVNIGGSYVLRPGGLAALVDRLGGIDVDVDTDVLSKAANGATTVVVGSGQHKLTGAQAYAYASYSTSPTESDAVRLVRFNVVLRGVVDKLPARAPEVVGLLNGLDATSTLPLAETAALLATLGQVDGVRGAVGYDTLPVREIDTGSAALAYGLDVTASEALLKAHFAGSLQGANGAALKVLVENGVGTPGLVDKARARLVTAGFRFVNGGNATQFGFTQTAVLIPDASQANQTKGEKVAKALGVPVGDVQTSARGQNVADVIVILGKDFKP